MFLNVFIWKVLTKKVRVSYPISDFGYLSPQEALDDGMLLCDADTDYLWYEEFNEFALT